MNSNYLINSFYRLGELWRKQDLLETQLADSGATNILVGRTASRSVFLAELQARRQARAEQLLAKENQARMAKGDFELTLEDVLQELQQEDGFETPEITDKQERVLNRLELQGRERHGKQVEKSNLCRLRIEINNTRFEISDILFELGLREAEEDDLNNVKELATLGYLESYKIFVSQLREKVARKVAIVIAGYQERSILPMKNIPVEKLAALASPMDKAIDDRVRQGYVEDLIVVKAGEIDERILTVAKLVLDPSYDRFDRLEALRNFRQGISTILSPGEIYGSLADALLILRTMESSQAGKALLGKYDLSQLFDMSNPVIVIALAVHFSKEKVNYKKVYAVRKMMIGEDSAMNKLDWVKLFKKMEDLQVAEVAEWQHFVGVFAKQCVNTAIYTAAQEGEYCEFHSGADLIDATLFSDHRPEEREASQRLVIDNFDQIFYQLPDRVQNILEAIRDYNSVLFREIMATFYENGLWFAAIKKGNVKFGLKRLWGKHVMKMDDLLDRMLSKAGVYQGGSLASFKNDYYGNGIEQSIQEALALNAVSRNAQVDNILPASPIADQPVSEVAQPVTPKEDNPFDI